MGAETNREGLPRISADEYFPKVGQPEEPLKILTPTFGEKLIEAIKEALSNGGAKRAELELIHQGENPQTLKAIIENSQEPGGLLKVRLEGDWDTRLEILQGHPLLANFRGVFFRKSRPEDPEPIAEEGQTLAPDDPIGLASAGKGNYWLWRLPETDFPQGGKITKFIHPDGGEVEPGVSVICFVEKM